jgi:excisionase family DNA binding protein
LQPVETVQVEHEAVVQPSPGMAPIRTTFVTSLLQAAVRVSGKFNGLDRSGGEVQEPPDGVRLLKVKEVARILRVCTATVYNMIERGELEHVRVSNAIRVMIAPSNQR